MRNRDLPAIRNRDDSGAVLGDFKKHRHSEVEMRTRRVTPAAIVTRLSEVRRTEVSSSDENRRTAGVTPSRVVSTLNLETSTATEPVVEQSGT